VAVAVLVGVELGALAAYLETAAVAVHQPRYYLYPLVWITVTAWLLLRVRPEPGTPSLPAGLGSAVYLVALLAVSGTVRISRPLSETVVTLSVLPVQLLGHAGGASTGGYTVEWLAPGWGPYVAYEGVLVTFRVVPFQVIGYLGLAYLVFVALARADRSALCGAGGLVTCVGCVWPALTAVSTALGGGTAVTAVASLSYDLATLLFLGTVTAMCWLLSADAAPQTELPAPLSDWRSR
jgi:hypothetical protein